MDADDVKEMGFPCDVEELVFARAKKALDAGVDGVIASAREAAEIRQQTAQADDRYTGNSSSNSASDDQNVLRRLAGRFARAPTISW